MSNFDCRQIVLTLVPLIEMAQATRVGPLLLQAMVSKLWEELRVRRPSTKRRRGILRAAGRQLRQAKQIMRELRAELHAEELAHKRLKKFVAEVLVIDARSRRIEAMRTHTVSVELSDYVIRSCRVPERLIEHVAASLVYELLEKKDEL